MNAEPLDDDYGVPVPTTYEDSFCPMCGRWFHECGCEVEEELRLDAEWEALTRAAIPNLGPP
jgi:hypothetical protein